MEINNKIVKRIRPITLDEYEDWIDDIHYGIYGKNIFVAELNDGTVVLPKSNCITCMKNNDCLITQINQLK